MEFETAASHAAALEELRFQVGIDNGSVVGLSHFELRRNGGAGPSKGNAAS
jgi:hypothetical protein